MKNFKLSLTIASIALFLFSCNKDLESDLYINADDNQSYDFITVIEETKNSITYSLDYEKLGSDANLQSKSINLKHNEYRLMMVHDEAMSGSPDSNNAERSISRETRLILMPVIPIPIDGNVLIV